MTYSSSGVGLVSNNINLIGAAATTSVGQWKSEQTSLGLFVQEQVGYKAKPYLTAVVRVRTFCPPEAGRRSHPSASDQRVAFVTN